MTHDVDLGDAQVTDEPMNVLGEFGELVPALGDTRKAHPAKIGNHHPPTA
ncbi:MAG: hypothetical protein JWR34_5985 [Mycobacterium sp.]|nr:hypothetical protein [Mycobacterium sp.]